MKFYNYLLDNSKLDDLACDLEMTNGENGYNQIKKLGNDYLVRQFPKEFAKFSNE